MTPENFEPIEEALQQLLELEKVAELENLSQAKARVRMKLTQALGPTAFSSAQSDASFAKATVSQAAAKAAFVGKSLWLPATTFLLGGITGMAVLTALRPSPEIPSTPPPPAFSAQPSSPVTPPPAAPVPPNAPPRVTPAVPVAAPPSTPASESLLWLNQARNALMRQDFTSALQTLDRHKKKFPHDSLREERDVLYIQALVSLGQKERAEYEAQNFLRAFPNSLLRPVVEQAVEPTP